MYFSKPQDPNFNSFSLPRARTNDLSIPLIKQDRNQIKINKSKLPSDFFKKSLNKSLPRKAPLDSSPNRLAIPKTTALRKCPQTQRKINSYNQLPESTQFDFPLDLTISKTHHLRAQVEQRKSISRKSHLMELNTGDDDFQHIKMIKDYVKPKCLRRNEASQIIEANSDLRYLIRQRFPNKFNTEQFLGESPSIPQEIDMTCTFGKGFKFSQNQNNTSLEFSNGKQSRERYRGQEGSNRKLFEEKSTEESEVYEGLKMSENSRVRAQSENKIQLAQQTGAFFDQEKSSKIQWNVSRQELPPFQNIQVDNKSKEVFTSEERERRSKYRINNSSNDHRMKALRKEKKLGELNLPKISKGSSNYKDSSA